VSQGEFKGSTQRYLIERRLNPSLSSIAKAGLVALEFVQIAMARKSKTKPPTSSITMKQALTAARRVKKKFEKSPQLPAS
jgi:hypothetical protein